MRPWERLDAGPVPGGEGELVLYRRGDEFVIKVGPTPLMGSRMHGSEDALAELGCRHVAGSDAAVLVGGLGMGFTLAATLGQLGAGARVVVAELAPVVIAWNRSWLAPLAGAPLEDPRSEVFAGDVARAMRQAPAGYDAILLDVDNGPDGLTQRDNRWLYSEAGIRAARRALRPGGVLAVWSEGPSPLFTERLERGGFAVEQARPRAHGRGRGGRHTIWLARRPD